MTWIRTFGEEEADGLLRKTYDEAVRRAGRVWNILKVMSQNPRQLRCAMAFYVSVMKADSGLAPRMRETLAVVVSRANHCHY